MKSNKLKNQKPIVAHNTMNKDKKKEAFSYSIYNNENFKNFCQLKEDSTTKLIEKKDLPLEFNEELCDFLNLFRRKTVNENTEWEFYIDYENDEIIHCFSWRRN